MYSNINISSECSGATFQRIPTARLSVGTRGGYKTTREDRLRYWNRLTWSCRFAKHFS